MTDFLAQLDLLRATERRVAMATLVAARGGSPRPLGAKLFVGEGGRLVGSVSIGGCVDARVAEHGERLLREGRAEQVTVTVDDAEAVELGLNCGAEFDLLVEPIAVRDDDPAIAAYTAAARMSRSGRAAWVVTRFAPGTVPLREVRDTEPAGEAGFVERVGPADTLLLVGASDVAAALARFAAILGWRVVVVDDRERYATRERFGGAEVLVGMPAELARPHLGAGSFVVLTSHDYRHELPVLREALGGDVRYVGMLAGRKRATAIRSLLREDGLTDAQVARLHAPVGLDIGGREPEEIALSIAAQLVAVREGKPIAAR